MAYDENSDERIGNGHIVKALVEMEKYWNALQGDFVREEVEADPSEPPSRVEHRVNDKVRNVCMQAWTMSAHAFQGSEKGVNFLFVQSRRDEHLKRKSRR